MGTFITTADLSISSLFQFPTHTFLVMLSGRCIQPMLLDIVNNAVGCQEFDCVTLQ